MIDWLNRLLPLRRPSGPRTTKSLAAPCFAFDRLASPAWAPRDYAAFAREGFMQNPVLYRAVRMVAEAAASVPLLLYQGEDEIAEHPLLDLLARPNPGATAPDLLEAWYGFLLVSGNAYLEAVAVGGTVRELHALRPDRMKVVPGPGGWPEAFVPPMLLGIPGDNTYSNYQEATRTFWRSTVLPLVNRTAKSLSVWLGPAYGDTAAVGSRQSAVGIGDRTTADARLPTAGLELRPDLDAIEALSTEREALWTRINAATFLTDDEKRAAVGYGPMGSDPAGLIPGE